VLPRGERASEAVPPAAEHFPPTVVEADLRRDVERPDARWLVFSHYPDTTPNASLGYVCGMAIAGMRTRRR
jgi:hypothetical protein